MGEDYRSDPALRLLGRYATGGVDGASGDDLQNYETSKLPNRALAWAANTLLCFDKNDSTTTTELVGTEPLVVKPNVGPGCWKAIAGDAFSALSVGGIANNDAVDIVVTAANTWSVLPNSNWGAFPNVPVSSPLWTLSTSGTFTYNGPEALFSIDAFVTVVDATAATTQVISLLLTTDAGTIAGLTQDYADETRTTATLQLEQQLGVSKLLRMGPINGTDLQLLFRSVNGDDYTLTRGIIRINPIGLISA